jgi:hypothetical protein
MILRTAQLCTTTLGRFHHYDLRLDNIMEHTPSPDDCAQDELSRFVMGKCHADAGSRKERWHSVRERLKGCRDVVQAP